MTRFYPDQGLGVFHGDGAVLTDDEALAQRVAARASAMAHVHGVLGINSRVDTMQSVMRSGKWTGLDVQNAALSGATRRYTDLLDDVPGSPLPRRMKGDAEVWYVYVVRLLDWDSAQAHLVESAIGAVLYCPTSGHLTDAYAPLRWGGGSVPVTERAASQILSLAMHLCLTAVQQAAVTDVLGPALIENTVR